MAQAQVMLFLPPVSKDSLVWCSINSIWFKTSVFAVWVGTGCFQGKLKKLIKQWCHPSLIFSTPFSVFVFCFFSLVWLLPIMLIGHSTAFANGSLRWPPRCLVYPESWFRHYQRVSLKRVNNATGVSLLLICNRCTAEWNMNEDFPALSVDWCQHNIKNFTDAKSHFGALSV